MAAVEPESTFARVDQSFTQDFGDSKLHVTSQTINFGVKRDDELLDAVVWAFLSVFSQIFSDQFVSLCVAKHESQFPSQAITFKETNDSCAYNVGERCIGTASVTASASEAATCSSRT